MANYLLLRNNKESGPHSLDELMELGLKPYDLVWVQGKSAAWRYPSEVEELKPFAPVVEEQPFDRFYKKQTEEKKQIPVQQVETIAPEHEKYIPKKSVYVTMPGQKSSFVKPAVKEESYQPAAPVQQTISVTENPIAAQVKYSQPLDEIKEMYVKTLHERKQKIARKGFWLQNLKRAAVILSLIAVGLIAGFFIKSNGNSKNALVKNSNQAQPRQMPPDAMVKEPESASEQNANTVEQDMKPIPPPNGGFVNGPHLKTDIPQTSRETITRNDDASTNNVKKETALLPSQKEINTNTLQIPGVETNAATGERSRKVRTEGASGIVSGPAEKKAYRSNDHLAGLVSVASNEYKKVAFGGIRNLELTITNDSKYTLDNVIVELQYLKPSEQPLKTENIEFKSVGPKATSTLRIPDTNRGIKVAYRIINIKSRQMDELASGN